MHYYWLIQVTIWSLLDVCEFAHGLHGAMHFSVAFLDGCEFARGLQQTGTICMAVPLWFGMFAANLYFTNKCFGSSLLPWNSANSLDSAVSSKLAGEGP